jgi:hypothetical protein
MVGANHRDQNDHMVDGLQLWQRDIEQWENTIMQFSSYGWPNHMALPM